MPNSQMRIVFIGDVVGRYGRRYLRETLPLIKEKYKPDLIVANGENLAGGLGVTKKTADEVFNIGIHILTTGNHVWDKKEALDLLKLDDRIIRPLNFPASNPGRGFCDFELDNGIRGLIVNLQGRVFMEPVVDNPFTAIDLFLRERDEKVILVDFHAEATAEKQAMGFFLEGRVSAILGSHTHVPTDDLRILPRGTAYQSDVGMTGALNSVIGMKKEPIVTKFLTGINQRFEVDRGDMILDMTILDIRADNGKTVAVDKIRLHESTFADQLKP